jgi:RNA polymerase sigma-70 factor (ECF subfamily)
VRSSADPRAWQSAWERLVNLYGPLVYRWCLRAGLQPADAADVGQEVFLAVARSIGQFRREREGDSFRGWLYAITRNKIRDAGRRHREVPLGGGDNPLQSLEAAREEPEAADPPADAEGRALLYRRALDLIQGEFEGRTWQAFWCVAVDARRPADVAADLGMSVGAVYVAKSRILRRLHEEFSGLLSEG